MPGGGDGSCSSLCLPLLIRPLLIPEHQTADRQEAAFAYAFRENAHSDNPQEMGIAFFHLQGGQFFTNVGVSMQCNFSSPPFSSLIICWKGQSHCRPASPAFQFFPFLLDRLLCVLIFHGIPASRADIVFSRQRSPLYMWGEPNPTCSITTCIKEGIYKRAKKKKKEWKKREQNSAVGEEKQVV